MAIRIFVDQGHNPSGPNTGAEGHGLREQDKPIDFVRLSEAQKELIGRAEKEFGFTVTF